MKLLSVAVCLFLWSDLIGAASQKNVKELQTAVQQMLDAIGAGDRPVFERWLADDFILVNRDGSVANRKEFLDGVAPLPPGYKGRIVFTEVETRNLGNTVVLVGRAIEDLQIFTEALHVNFRNTFVFARRGGRWKLVAWQYVEFPKDPQPARLEPARLDDYVGEYTVSNELQYVVSRKGDVLFGSRAGRKDVELIPESIDVFFIPGSEIRKLFVRDDAGRVVEMVDRRKGTDLRWRRK